MPSEGTVQSKDGHSTHPWKGGRITVVSNRGPVEYRLDDAGRVRPGPAVGGMVTALADMGRHLDVTWVAAALSEGDRQVARRRTTVSLDDGCRLRFVPLPSHSYELYYDVVSNPLLWYLQHGIWDRLERPHLLQELHYAWEWGYRPANEAFAAAAREELADGTAVVLFQDYHLYLAPRYVREWAPDAVLQHFVHIPWPPAEAWRALPLGMVRAICDGLLANDAVRFQTQGSLRNFLVTCREFLPGTHVDVTGERVRYAGSWTRLCADPIALDTAKLRRQAASRRVKAYREALAAPEGVSTIVRVDRLDPVKNVVAGFEAYERLLEGAPSLRGRVRFLAFLVPTRLGVPEYRRYSDEVFALVDRVNERYGTSGWQPVQVLYENNHAQALAGMALSDVLLVNPLADGMNLVSLEGPTVNRRDGVLVLSRRAGSYEHLREGALAIEPGDVEGTAEALYRALTMPAGERRRRARALKRAAAARDLRSWLEGQLDDLAAAALERQRRRELVAMPEDYRVSVSA